MGPTSRRKRFFLLKGGLLLSEFLGKKTRGKGSLERETSARFEKIEHKLVGFLAGTQ